MNNASTRRPTTRRLVSGAVAAAFLICVFTLPCGSVAVSSHTLRHRQRGSPGAQPSILAAAAVGDARADATGAATEVTTETTTPRDSMPTPRQPPPPPPLEVTARLHQAARLPCAVLGGGAGGGATWRHGERRLPDEAEAHRYSLEPRSGELRVSNVRADDAGLWHCEPRAPGGGIVPTRPVLLIVTDPPRAPYLEVDGRRLDPGNVFLPVLEGAPLAVGCVAEGGLPPPELSWRLGGVPLSDGLHGNVNPAVAAASAPASAAAAAAAAAAAEGHGGRVRSEVRLPRVLRAHHNATVTCLVRHSALPRPLNASLLLDVQYTPSFAISREPGFGFPLVEGIPVSLKCEVDANPPSAPLWLKDDGPPPVSQSADGYLNYSAIRREHSGWYKCTSREFSSIGYFLNVRYEESPDVTMDPGPGEASSTHRQVEVALGGAVQLQCPLTAPANGGAAVTPACWSRVGVGGALEPFAAGPELSLERVLYQEAGTYRCAAPASTAPSPALQHWRNLLDVTLSVFGRPIVYPSNASVSALTGQSVALRVEFCANPPADRALWLMATLFLRPGEALGRVTALPVEEGPAPHCQQAKLMLYDVRPSDAGEYAFQVRSPRGLAEGSVIVNVTRASEYALGAGATALAAPTQTMLLLAATLLTAATTATATRTRLIA